MRAYIATVFVCLLGACGMASSATAPSPCSGFQNAYGPYATVHASFTALPSAVQFEAERDVISLGEVPRVIVRAGNAGIGRFNETPKFAVTNPDGSKNEGHCDPAREPGTSAGFAALNFKCHPFTQIGVYTIRFDPASSGLSGDPVELRLRVVKEVPKTPPAPAGWQSLALTSGLPQSDCYSYGESYVAAFDHAGLVKGEGPGTTAIPTPLASRMSDDHARGVKYVFETDDGWVVMFDHGEFGGGTRPGRRCSHSSTGRSFARPLKPPKDRGSKSKEPRYSEGFSLSNQLSVTLRPQGDSNPCYSLERAVSWAGLDDGDLLQGRGKIVCGGPLDNEKSGLFSGRAGR